MGRSATRPGGARDPIGLLDPAPSLACTRSCSFHVERRNEAGGRFSRCARSPAVRSRKLLRVLVVRGAGVPSNPRSITLLRSPGAFGSTARSSDAPDRAQSTTTASLACRHCRVIEPLSADERGARTSGVGLALHRADSVTTVRQTPFHVERASDVLACERPPPNGAAPRPVSP